MEVIRVSVSYDIEGDVDIEASPRPLTHMVIVSLVQVWPPVSLLVPFKNYLKLFPDHLASPVDGDVHDPVVVIELPLGALAVVHVPVHDQDPLQPRLESLAGAKSDVIEVAVATGLRTPKYFWEYDLKARARPGPSGRGGLEV